MLKVAAVFVMFFAEGVCIYSENLIAKKVAGGAGAWECAKALPLLTAVWSVALLVAYGIGMKAFGRIWMVSVVSLAAICVMEPIIVWNCWREMPSLGEGIGMACGLVGLISALLI